MEGKGEGELAHDKGHYHSCLDSRPLFHLFPLVPPFSIEGELYRPRLKHTPRGMGNKGEQC